MRQFLAIELPAALRQVVVETREQLRRRLTGWRWVRPEGIHLTLRFLGEVSDERDARCRRAWGEAAAAGRSMTLSLAGLGSFPSVRRPRVLWLGVQETSPGDGLATLAGALEVAARDLGFPPATRAFRPHLTLARAAHGRRGELPQGLALEPVRAEVSQLVLFRSRLEPTGARYTALERYALGG